MIENFNLSLCLFPLKLVNMLDTLMLNSRTNVFCWVHSKDHLFPVFIICDGENNVLSSGTPSVVVVEHP